MRERGQGSSSFRQRVAGYRPLDLANPPGTPPQNVSPKDGKHTCLPVKGVPGFLSSHVCKKIALLTIHLLGLGSDEEEIPSRGPLIYAGSTVNAQVRPAPQRLPGSSQDAGVLSKAFRVLPLPLWRSVQRGRYPSGPLGQSPPFLESAASGRPGHPQGNGRQEPPSGAQGRTSRGKCPPATTSCLPPAFCLGTGLAGSRDHKVFNPIR